MANDINKAISSNDIKNGTLIIGIPGNTIYATNNNYVTNKPILNNIEAKYENRFDDPSYYYGSNTDGGNV